MKRLLLIAVLATVASLFAVSPALAVPLVLVTGTASAEDGTGSELIPECVVGGDPAYCPPPPPPPPPPAPPPPPPSEDLEVGAFETASSSLQYFGTTRCKRQTFKQTFTQANLYSVMRYEGSFRVCYKHGQGIVSYSDVHGDMTWTRIPWEWRGNDTDYPHGIKYSRHVVFDYRGSAAFCVIPYACGPTKHPWVRIVFYDNNTLTKDAGVN